MGKGKKHDRLYVTATEHSGAVGAHGAFTGYTGKPTSSLRRLPFDCCALSLQPFETPVLDKRDGTCFDRERLLQWIKEHGTNPVSGRTLTLDDENLVRIKMWRNANGEYHDPITFKVFNQHSHIVAIIPLKHSAETECNVFTYETIDRLNIKAKTWRDLVSDEHFDRHGIITIQDPQDPLRVNRDLSQHNKEPAKAGLPKEKETAPSKNLSNISTNRTAASLTSTSAPLSTRTERTTIDPIEVMFEEFRQGRALPGSAASNGKVHPAKAYARLSTSLGDLNVELHSDKVPKTVYNFVTLAKRGYYDGIPFHRNIPGFMIQGGSNLEGTGKGGQSAFAGGEPFEDEVTGRAKELDGHSRRGVMSMANSGPNSNRSQFFLTYNACRHLDGKHAIFGQVVGGFDILDKMEAFPTSSADNRPRGTGIILREVDILIDPFEKYNEKMRRKEDREEGTKEKRLDDTSRRRMKLDDHLTWLGTDLSAKGLDGKPAIGKYLKRDQAPSTLVQANVKKAKAGSFGDFSSW